MASKSLPRGLRNCNPGNIRRSKVRYRGEVAGGRDPEFREFESIALGYRAMFVLLHTYRHKHLCSTLREMISRYAPPSENNTEGYIARVARQSGVKPEEPIDTLDRATMVAIVCAMSAVENGVAAKVEEVEGGWREFIADFGK